MAFMSVLATRLCILLCLVSWGGFACCLTGHCDEVSNEDNFLSRLLEDDSIGVTIFYIIFVIRTVRGWCG